MRSKEIRNVLDYDPLSGIFRWKMLPHKCASKIQIGDVAGWLENNGYWRITIGNRRYVAHRLAWLYVYGKWPKGSLDHIDGDRSNNVISNLRLATAGQNKTNEKCRKDNLLGIKGVRLHETGRYHARIYINGRHKSLGLYDTPEEAREAYWSAAKEAWGDFARRA